MSGSSRKGADRSRREWAKQTVRLGLAGLGPTSDAASDVFDAEFEEALEILYGVPRDDPDGGASIYPHG